MLGVWQASCGTSVIGDYDHGLGATLEIELIGNGGGAPVGGVDFDQLVANTANLAGMPHFLSRHT